MASKGKNVSFVSQSEDSECGLAAIIMIGNYFGHDLDLTTMRRSYPMVGTRGMTLKDVISVASDLQLATRVLQVEIDKVGGLRLPCILQWEKNQFVVFTGMSDGKFNVLNPGAGPESLSVKDFSKFYTGVALELAPRNDFTPTTARTALKLNMIASNVKGLFTSASYLAIICAAIFMISLVMPFYSMLVMDEAINSRDVSLLNSLFITALMLAALQGATEFLRDRVILFLGGQFTLQSNFNLIAHLIKLPMSFFETRHAADIMSRVGAMEEVKQTLTEDLVKTMVDGIIVTATFSLLILYSWQLSVMVIIYALITGIWRLLIFNKFQEAQGEMFTATAQEQSCLMETIRGMQSIKLYGIEAERLNLWNRIFSRKLNAYLQSHKLMAAWAGFDRFIIGIEDVSILFVGAYLVLQNNLTLGVLLSFMTYKTQFSTKFLQVLEKIVTFAMLKIHLERLSDILLQDREPEVKANVKGVLTGQIELRDIKFRYSPSDPFLFNDLCLVLESGESAAIIGPSGAGKTTLFKIMLGLIEPHSGDISTDGLSIKGNQENYRKGIATVMQDDCILSGTIMDNITFFDKNPDLEQVQKAAMDAWIHDDIMKMSMGYQTPVSDYNNTISGGQKQRILIARAVYRRPKIMFMDEATSALDVKNEKLVNAAMKRLGITRIIIAHRPETINSADKVFILEAGKLRLREEKVIANIGAS